MKVIYWNWNWKCRSCYLRISVKEFPENIWEIRQPPWRSPNSAIALCRESFSDSFSNVFGTCFSQDNSDELLLFFIFCNNQLSSILFPCDKTAFFITVSPFYFSLKKMFKKLLSYSTETSSKEYNFFFSQVTIVNLGNGHSRQMFFSGILLLMNEWKIALKILLALANNFCQGLNPFRPNPGRREKVKWNFHIHSSLRCLKRFYEGRKGRGYLYEKSLSAQ